MSASPITKGGVMIGRTLSTRRSTLYRKPVRVAMSANERPSAVVPTPTMSARKREFHATPQRSSDVRQSSPQIERSVNFLRNSAAANSP
jgi:hypothetical protein